MRLFFALLALALACNAQAQAVYKIIGKDGKVTYSDRPTDSEDAKTSVIANAPRPALTVEKIEETVPDGSARSAKKAKRALASASASNAASSTDAADSADAKMHQQVRATLLTVLSREMLVGRMREICFKTLPTSGKRYDGIIDGWEKRNASALGQAHRLLNDMETSLQSGLKDAIKRSADSMFAPVESAKTASRIKWCDSSTAELEQGIMDFHVEAAVLANASIKR